MFELYKDVNAIIPIRLELSGVDVTGKVAADLTVQLANDDSADWESLTPTTHFTLNELSEGDYTLTILAAINDTYGHLRLKISGTGFDTKQYVIGIIPLKGYDGKIWIDTNNGEAGTVIGVSGTAFNPVDNLADALTLSASLGINSFHVLPRSEIIAGASIANYYFCGCLWELNFNAQEIEATCITGADIYGISSGEAYQIRDCTIIGDGGVTITTSFDAGIMDNCRLLGEASLTEAAVYTWNKIIAGRDNETGILTFAATSAGGVIMNLTNFSGTLTLKDFDLYGTDYLLIEGNGKLILDSSCGGANNSVINIRGNIELVDNVVGGFVAGGGVLNQDARIDSDQIQAADTAALNAYDPPTNTEMEARTLATASYATAAVLSSVATDITLARKLLQNRKEFDLDASKMYIWNDAGDAREYEITLTDDAGDPVTTTTTGPINATRWTAVA